MASNNPKANLNRPLAKSLHKQPSLAQIRRVLRAHLPVLRKRYGVRTLGIFGSYVRGEQRKSSDLDVLVEFDLAPTFFEFIDLEEHLSNLLKVKVELVMKSALKPAIGQRILTELVRI
jgi:hypothetical protein